MLGAKHCAHILLREPKYCGIHQSDGGFVKQQYIASLEGILYRGLSHFGQFNFPEADEHPSE